MYDPISKTWQAGSIVLWLDFILASFLLAFILILQVNVLKRKSFTVAGIICSIVSALSWFFGLKFVWSITILLMTAYLVVTIIQNQNDVRDFAKSIFKKCKKKL